jgi:hypothetical protein
VTNLLAWLPCLTEAERKLIAEAMRRYDPEKPVIDYNNDGEIGFLGRERVIAALWLYGTNAALDLACKVSMTTEI